ncbi:MAG: hypothetical protein JKY98_06475 [Gammaproteobacteria bacterium]|nr:hypothetical protein [Gammaproteobacteria bacterium]
MHSQKGAYLVIVSLLLVVLMGFGALTLDLGRLFVLRSEMQNAADSAALAAARELGKDAGAQARANTAARFVLEHDAKFASVQELLETNIELDFFCAIGSEFDPDPMTIGHCVNAGTPVDGRVTAENDLDSHYVRVRLDPSDADNRYSIQLMFLPVLNLFLDDVASTASLNASAIAGRNFFACDFPPVMLCNPFEPDGDEFDDRMDAGDQIILNQQGGNAWAPGNFSFLDLGGGGGAGTVAGYLADEALTGCKAPILRTATGEMTLLTSSAINTRFDVYSNPNPFNRPDAPDNWPPAPNVIDYPQDVNWQPLHPRFGTGNWQRNNYFNIYHDWQGHGRPGGWNTMSRWGIYNWELDENKLPSKNPLWPGPGVNTDNTTYDGIPDPGHLNLGSYPPPRSIPERRVFNVAVVNCTAHNITGTQTFPVFGQEGFAKLFLTQQASIPPNVSIFAEYIEWASGVDSNIHIDVQLYE